MTTHDYDPNSYADGFGTARATCHYCGRAIVGDYRPSNGGQERVWRTDDERGSTYCPTINAALRERGYIVDTVHGHGDDSAEIPWDDGAIVITTDGDRYHDRYLLGVYGDGWTVDGGDDIAVTHTVGSLDAMCEIVDGLTTLQPEGTHWASWARQWVADNYNGEQSTI